MKANTQTRMILQLDFPIAAKAAATVEKRAKALQNRASKKGAKLRILIPGLILYTSVLRALDIKVGPNDKAGQPKYRIFRGKLNDVDPKAKPAKPVKATKAAKAAKIAKPAKVVAKVKPTRKPRVAKVEKVEAPAAPAASAPAVSQTPAGATAETTPPARPVPVPPALATEVADSQAANTPAAATQTHAKRS